MSLTNSCSQASTAKVTRSRPTKVARIADKIVDLVERTDGPVLLHEVGEEVPGFKARGPKGYTYFISFDGKETVYWAGMTKAGYEALRSVLNERRVAVQYVSPFLYFFEGVQVDDKNWQPIALLPVRAANIDTPKWAARVRPIAREILLKPGNGQFRPLTPQPVRFTADDFSTM